MPDEATDNGFPSAEDVDVEALFQALREEIRRSGADPGAGRTGRIVGTGPVCNVMSQGLGRNPQKA